MGAIGAVSPASRVASCDPTTWLRTGVSSGTGPRLLLKSRKYRAHLEDPAGTEYLEDVALEQCGKVWGSRRSPGRQLLTSIYSLICMLS